MSKEFEALERLAMPDDLHIKECEKLGISPTQDYEIIKETLQRLETIDNSNPSEALEQVKFFKSQDFYDEIGQHYGFIDERCKVIEEALIKAQEQKQVLEIIKEKDVDIYILKNCKTVDEYNSSVVHIVGETRELTQEEFELLKRYVDEQQVK